MEPISTLENNIRTSFDLVKKDMNLFKVNFNKQSRVIKQLYENQKLLLVRIKELEAMVRGSRQERIMEKSIVMSSNRTAPRQQFVASGSSMKIHNAVCPFAKNIKPKNKIIFNTKAKAFNNGFRACDCLKKV